MCFDFWLSSSVDVFLKTEGVYIIHSNYFHPEDVDFDDAEAIPHYIVYNAGTRVLFLYPEVVVLEDEDIADIPAFVLKLRNVPFQTRLISDKGSYARRVRRLAVKNCQESKKLPMASHSCITK
ncbi:hypothetical protein AB1Y20_015828 [Prymnesium parvum]|uniref:FACT complex subunit n=1 Tax=Prymnesium parvum TaxID=97485 RepID=A0AB34K2K7_PRYPA